MTRCSFEIGNEQPSSRAPIVGVGGAATRFMRSVAQSAERLWRNAERSRAILPIMASVLFACIGSAMLTTAVSLRLGEPGVPAYVVQLVLTAYPAGFLAGCLVT